MANASSGTEDKATAGLLGKPLGFVKQLSATIVLMIGSGCISR